MTQNNHLFLRLSVKTNIFLLQEIECLIDEIDIDGDGQVRV